MEPISAGIATRGRASHQGSARSVRALVALALLAVAPTALGQWTPQSPYPELRRRTLTIDDQGLLSLPEIHVGSGTTSVVTFQAPLRDGGAFLADVQGLFYPLTQTERAVLVSPRADLKRPIPLHVSLADGTVLSFKLVTVPRDVDVQVDVVLALKKRAAPDSVPGMRATVEALRNDLEECSSSSAGSSARKIATLLLSQGDDKDDVFERHPLRVSDKQQRLLVRGRATYRLFGLTYLVFAVENRDPERSWGFDRAEVRLAGGGESADVKVVAASSEPPLLQPGDTGRVVVAFRTPSQGAAQRFNVALREREGARHLLLEGLVP